MTPPTLYTLYNHKKPKHIIHESSYLNVFENIKRISNNSIVQLRWKCMHLHSWRKNKTAPIQLINFNPMEFRQRPPSSTLIRLMPANWIKRPLVYLSVSKLIKWANHLQAIFSPTSTCVPHNSLRLRTGLMDGNVDGSVNALFVVHLNRLPLIITQYLMEMSLLIEIKECLPIFFTVGNLDLQFTVVIE